MNLDFSILNWSLIQNFILKGLWFSILLTAVATAGGIFFGTLLALMRLSGNKLLTVPATIYVNGMRSIPLVMVILWFFLLVPMIIGRSIGAEYSAIITFVAFEAAYFSEIVRAGIQSIPRGQVFAGQALGMSYGQNMRLVVLPQAVRIGTPPTVGFMVQIVKNTSLASIVGFIELVRAGQLINNSIFQPFLVYLLIAVIYFALCYPLSVWSRKLEQRQQFGNRAATPSANAT